jgi:hypothetical protein
MQHCGSCSHILTAFFDIQAGLFAIRARRRICEEGDYLKAVEKVKCFVLRLSGVSLTVVQSCAIGHQPRQKVLLDFPLLHLQ